MSTASAARARASCWITIFPGWAFRQSRCAGYEQEEYTHLAVAAAVASGSADCGLGIMAAARALDLDFIPLYNEQYQLVIPTRYYESSLLEPLRDLMQNLQFRQLVQSLDGYEVDKMGLIVRRYS